MKETGINGQGEFHVTRDYKICLPAFCEAKYKDKVVILAKEDYIEIWDFITFYKFIQSLDEKSEKDSIASFVYDNNVSVGVKKAINLTSYLVKKYDLKNGIRIEGHDDHICIFKKDNSENLQESFQLSDKEQSLDEKKSNVDNFNLPVKLWRNRVYVTTLLKKSNIHSSKVVLVPRKDFIEIHDYFEFVGLVEEADKKYQQEPTIKNKKYLDSLLFILKNRCRDIRIGSKGNSYMYLPFPIIDYYNLKFDLMLEAQDGYFRIWEADRFEIYQKQMREEMKNDLFLQKMKERVKRNI